MGATKQAMLEAAEDETLARCGKCGEPLGSWAVIRAGHCPSCQVKITERDIANGWVIECGEPMRGDECGMETCFDCCYGGPGYD